MCLKCIWMCWVQWSDLDCADDDTDDDGVEHDDDISWHLCIWTHTTSTSLWHCAILTEMFSMAYTRHWWYWCCVHQDLTMSEISFVTTFLHCGIMIRTTEDHSSAWAAYTWQYSGLVMSSECHPGQCSSGYDWSQPALISRPVLQLLSSVFNWTQQISSLSVKSIVI